MIVKPATESVRKRNVKFAGAIFALAVCAAISTGCKKQPAGTTEARKPPDEPFVAYYRPVAGGAPEVWRVKLPGGNPEKWFTADAPARSAAAQTSTGALLLVFNTVDSHAYYAAGGRIYTNPPGRTSPLANPGGASGRAIEALWLSRDGLSLLAMLPGSGDVRPEFIRLDLRSGAWKTITPADTEWDGFDLSTPEDMCITECAGRTVSAPGGNSFMLEPGPPSAAGWPRLVIKSPRGTFTATDGSRRIIGARWTPGGRAVVFVEADTAPGEHPAGAIMLADPVAENVSVISKSQHTASALYNISERADALFFAGPEGGLFRFSFKTHSTEAVDAIGTSPALVE